MDMDKNKRIAQSVLEYAILIGLVGAALASMQLCFQRGIQSAIKITADTIGSQSEAEERDIDKGAKAASKVRMTTIGGLASGNTQEVTVNKDGSRTIKTHRISEMKEAGPAYKEGDEHRSEPVLKELDSLLGPYSGSIYVGGQE